MAKPLPINFNKIISGKPLQGDGIQSKPVFRLLVLRASQLQEPDTSDREESLKAGWDEFLASIRSTAGTSQQGTGNFSPIIAVGLQSPYEIVSGRRRYLACRELDLPIDAKLYPFLSDEEKARFRYSENFQRNNYTLPEIIASVQRELAQGRTREWLSTAFGKTTRSIDAYIAISKDARLTEEVKRGLSRREASRLIQEFGEKAADEALKLRQMGASQMQESHSSKARRQGGKDERTADHTPLMAKVVPGVKVSVHFDEWKAAKEDFLAYGKWLDAERERIGAINGAHSLRKQGEA